MSSIRNSMVAPSLSKARTPLGMTQATALSSSSSSTSSSSQVKKQVQVHLRNPKGSNSNSNKKEARRRKTVSILKPPPGLQFLTVFDCKYYGSSTLGPEENKSVAPSECARLVRQTVSENKRKHTPALLHMTDRGVQIEGKGHDFTLEVDQLRKIVPGTINCKSGKQLRVALVVERFADENGLTPYHVIQFKQADDLRHLAEAVKRMWRDHMFTALLDVSTEQGQDDFDVNMIEDDIERINERCSMLITQEMNDFESALDGMLNGEHIAEE